MPYFVDYEVRDNSSVKDVNLSGPSSVVSVEANPSAEAISEPNEQCLSTEINEQCYTLRSEDDNMLAEGPVTNTQIIAETDKLESVMKDQSDNSLSITQSSSEHLMLEDAAVVRSSSCQEDLCPSQLICVLCSLVLSSI